MDTARVSRRSFLGAAASVTGAALLAACGSSAKSGASTTHSGKTHDIKFWDMPWGSAVYTKTGSAVTAAYHPPAGLPKASYQTIQWSNFTSTFGAAIASGTGPAVSSGGGFQSLTYAAEGKIAYADDLIDALRKNGTLADYLPNLVDLFRTPQGYAAVPWNLDLRVFIYRKSVFDKLDLQPPTSWDELTTVAKALKKGGYAGFGLNGGAGSLNGYQQLLALMINNGGGLFNADGDPDCVTTANVDAMQFVTDLVKQGLIPPQAVSYTDSNAISQWGPKGSFAMGINDPGYALDTGNSDIVVMPEPLSSSSGSKGTLVYVNNLMMYKESPSQAGSQAFLEYYLKHLGGYWAKGVMDTLPVFKSIIATPAFKKQKNLSVAVDKWVPVSKPFAATGSTLTATLGKIDGGPQLIEFAQRILDGQDAKTTLTTLQGQLESVAKS